jgi:hypothetical protein
MPNLRSLGLCLVLILPGCIIPVHYEKHGSSATGEITGSVLDPRGHPAAGVEVQAIYLRGFATVPPPIPDAFVVGSARTDAQGQFRLVTSKRVDELSARTDDFRASGELTSVLPAGNVLRLRLTTRSSERPLRGRR